MLDFNIKEEDAVLVKEGPLRSQVATLFEKAGVPSGDAQLAADVLVAADLRGVDSHGVSNMLDIYLKGYRNGRINPSPNWRIIRESPSTATIDSDGGLGIIIAPKAMQIAIRKAAQTGVGMVVTGVNSRHIGMCAYHAMLALKHDMIGVCMASGGVSVLPTFGREKRVGTNPLAIAAPAGNEPPFVFDAATSTIAGNKVMIAHRLGAKLLPGWVADENGLPVMEPAEPAAQLRTVNLLPLGSTREMGSHKGYGLACMMEILCGILSGGGFSMSAQPSPLCHMVAAYNIEAFTPLDQFKEMMDDFLRTLKATPPAPGRERVLVAGQLEWETERERRASGIPLHKDVVQWFRDTCRQLGAPFEL